MELENLTRSVVENPFERLVLRVSTCLLKEPKFYKSEEVQVSEIRSDLSIVESIEPSFIVKLAFYTRNSLNVRSISNYILAWASTKPSTHPTLRAFFTSIIRLPSDLIDFVEKYQQEIGSLGKVKIPTFLQKLIRTKFADFSLYQLGKYCSEGKRKRNLLKHGNKRLTMKKLIQLCHIKEPKNTVVAVLGKKYPVSLEKFLESGGKAEDFKEELSGKRMKIATPYTWETTLAKHGNKAQCWEELVKSEKLPFMAMLRNLRNMLLTGVDVETHRKVMEKMTNAEVIQNSRLFPFRFLSAYGSIEVDLDYMRKIKEDPSYEKEEPPQRNFRGGRARYHSSDEPAPIKKRKIIPKEVPSQEILDGYKESLNEAIKLATSLNIDPIRGKTAIFCDCSGSMDTYVSSKNVESFNSCRDVGFLFGLMVRSVSEEAEVFLFSSSPSNTEKCWLKAGLESDNIFESLKTMNELKNKLGGGTEFPYDWFEDAIKENKWIDNFIIFTDMMLSELDKHDVFSSGDRTSYQIINEYREKVNKDMRYITVDLAGSAKKLEGAKYESEFRNLLVGGYSDSILQFISTTGVMQSDFVRRCEPLHKQKLNS